MAASDYFYAQLEAAIRPGLDRIRLLDAFNKHIGECDMGCDCCEPTSEEDCAEGYPLWRDLQAANRALDDGLRRAAQLTVRRGNA